MLPVLLAIACGSPPPPVPVADEPYWVERSDLELDDTIKSACTEATQANQPVLLAFSAAWCGDCKKVRSLEAEEPLATELEQWTKVVVNVGKFDRHALLREAFGVSSIAYWVALQPDCSKPVTMWKKLRVGGFEPVSNPAGGRTSADLASWLRDARER